jgi:hypothetical protein
LSSENEGSPIATDRAAPGGGFDEAIRYTRPPMMLAVMVVMIGVAIASGALIGGTLEATNARWGFCQCPAMCVVQRGPRRGREPRPRPAADRRQRLGAQVPPDDDDVTPPSLAVTIRVLS